MNRLLVLDVGKTGCRAALIEDGARAWTAHRSGSCGVADRDGVPRALAAITGATTGWPAPAAVAAGLAGLASAPDRADVLADGLRARFGPAVRVLLTSDMTTWHAGALGGAPGVVLAAGTGTVALGVDDAGRSARVDGWGYLLGDAGSGHAIGRAGLDAALRAHDGRTGGSPALLGSLHERYGTPEKLPGLVHGSDNPAREVAAFARDVLAAAASGEAVAAAIVERAATDLADTAAAARDRLAGPGTWPIACAGGLLDAGPVLTDPLDAALAARCLTRTDPHGDALDGARLLLEDPTVPHHALLAPLSGALR